MTARSGNFLGFLACAGLLGYAYYAQYVLHLEPCPLCIFQRVGVFAMGVAFVAGAIANARGAGRFVIACLVDLASLVTVGIAAKHLYIQSLPEGSVPSCGASLQFMMKIFSLSEVIKKVLSGSGECAQITWRFLGLSMPGWVLIAALLLGAFGLWVNLKPPRLAPR